MIKLKAYISKRNFQKTMEPHGLINNNTKHGIFVVQEHHSKHLHYDFRLEVDGVLKSWAVPKGPSIIPNEKRLAIEVEDHPLDYASFQGIIPIGEYGAGKVNIWDKGTWLSETDVNSGLKNGKLEFILKGKKLKGHFVLIRLKNSNEPKKLNWLLMKKSEKEVDSFCKNIDNLVITHPEKIIFQVEKITKKDIVEYYKKISRYMLPLVKDRPLSVVRCPNGSSGKCFYQKHLGTGVPSNYFQAFVVKGKSKSDKFFSIDSAMGLIQLVQMNAYEIHVWNSHYQTLLNPDQIVLDFDPSPELSFNKVINACFELKKILDKLKLKSFVKVTGGKGVHVHIPISPIYDQNNVKAFAKAVVDKMVEQYPDLYLSATSKKLRTGKIFIDYLRNSFGATAVAPYSLRAKELSAVALPVEWSELKKIKSPAQFTIKKALQKIARRKSDPWKNILKLKQRITMLD